ncbi:Hypothetical predicted protein, partial [Marmota monax]
SYSSPEVRRAGLGLLEKQPQQGDSDRHRAEDTSGFCFPARSEDSLQPTISL